MKNKGSVVKVDSNLLKRVEELIKRNKYLYTSRKQVVDLAIIEFLKKKRLFKTRKRGKNEHKRNLRKI